MPRNTIVIACPFHAEATPSCVVSLDGSFTCMGCGATGGAVVTLRLEPEQGTTPSSAVDVTFPDPATEPRPAA